MDSIVLKSPGGFLISQTKRWRMGFWTATSYSLNFSHNNSIIWSCDYSSIINLHLEECFFSFEKKDSLCIKHDKENRMVWLIVENLKKWQNFIYAHTFHQLFIFTEEQIHVLAQKIDVLSEEILWYLWKNKHATLIELMALRTLVDQSEVLNRIKNIINPLAEKLFGFPFCVFKTEKKHPKQNRIIANNWWVNHLFPEEKV